MPVTPKMLDWAVNGVPVQIHKRPGVMVSRFKDAYYATVHDFARFNVPAVEVIRVPVPMSAPADWDPTQHESVLARLKVLNAGG